MSDLSMTPPPARTIPVGRAVLGGLMLLATGVALGLLLGEMSGPSMAFAPAPAPRGSGLTNAATEGSSPLPTGQVADLMRGSQERGNELQSMGPLNTAGPLQETGPINGMIASAAGAVPLMPGDVAGPRGATTAADRWTAVNDYVANALKSGTPTPETLAQLVSLVNGSVPPSGPSPVVPAGGPGTTPSVTPLPPTVYQGTAQLSPN